MNPLPHQHFLHFSRKERKGIILLLVLIVLVSFIPRIYQLFFPPKTFEAGSFSNELTLLSSQEPDSNDYGYPKNKYPDHARFNKSEKTPEIRSLFYFDPNTLPASQWKQFGFSDKVIRTIENYRQKGGKFREPNDLRKIWGISKMMADTLVPFVRIAAIQQRTSSESGAAYHEQKKKNLLISINEADSVVWEQLPGIGPVLAKRIVQFREKLGGFYRIEQVSETFGLADSTFQKIKERLKIADPVLIRKININTFTKEQLQQHPYIRFKIGSAIAAYRDQHGDYKSIDDLKKIMLIDDVLFNKIAPYLTVN
jgi:competence protein ComEA